VLKRFTYLLLILIGSFSVNGQNLILNPSFEDTSSNKPGVLRTAHWGFSTTSTPDFIHEQKISPWSAPLNYNGFQNPNDGGGYYGLFGYSKYLSEGREYLQGKLKTVLIKDSTYCFRMYISLSDSSQYAIKNNMGVFFTQKRLLLTYLHHKRIDTIPHIEFIDSTHLSDKVNWHQYDGRYTATGGERFLSIGVFTPDSLLDTISVSGGIDPVYDITYYYIDNLFLGHCDSLPVGSGAVGLNEIPRKEKGILLYPNPVRQFFTLETQATALSDFQLFNVMGQQFPLQAEKAANGFRFDAQHLPKGLYILQLGGDVPKAVKFIKR